MSKRKNAPGIVLYSDDLDALEELSVSQCGQLILALKASVQGAEVPEMDLATKVAYRFILPKVVRARENYEARAEQNRINGYKGGRPKTQKKPTVISKNPNITEKTQLELEQEQELEEKKNIQKEKIKSAWNDVGLSTVRKIDSDSWRYKQLRARINEYGIDGVLEAIEKVKNSEFLTGTNESGWTCTFDWLIKASNMLKVLEGNYDNRAAPRKKNDFTNFKQHDIDYNELEKKLDKQFKEMTDEGD